MHQLIIIKLFFFCFKPVTTVGYQGHKMPTSRCVHLMLVGISNGVKEMWIAQQPFLVFYYLWQYAPSFAWSVTDLLGRKRVQNFKAGVVSTSISHMQH